jgi:hypothetical protein
MRGEESQSTYALLCHVRQHAAELLLACIARRAQNNRKNLIVKVAVPEHRTASVPWPCKELSSGCHRAVGVSPSINQSSITVLGAERLRALQRCALALARCMWPVILSPSARPRPPLCAEAPSKSANARPRLVDRRAKASRR